MARLRAKAAPRDATDLAVGQDADQQAHDREVPRLDSARSIGIIACTSLAMIVNVSALGSMNIALPTVGRGLNIAPNNLQWLQTAYSLTSGCLLLLFGRISDIHGRKTVYLAGTAWLIAFTIGCGVSKDAITIIIMRALAGIGPAATIPASIGILASTFPPSHARTVAFATFQAGAPLGGAFSMILSGLTTQYVVGESWRVIFFVIAGIAALILVGGFLTFPPDEIHSTDRRVDWIGAALITAGLVLFMFCLGGGELAPQGWSTPYIIAFLVISLLLIGSFIAWEYYIETRTTRPPLMRLDLWTRGNGRFAAVQLVAFLVNAAFSTWSYWATLYYQNYLQLSPVLAMIRFLPMTVTGLLINFVFALVAGRVSGQLLLIIGCVGTGLADLLFALINPSLPYWAFGFPAAILSVFGADLIMSGGSLFGARVALPHEQSLAGGVFNTVTQIGTAFGMTVTTIVYDKVVRAESIRERIELNQYATNASPEAMLLGYRMAQWTLVAFAAFAGIVAAVTLRGIGVIGGSGSHNQPPPELPLGDNKTGADEPSSRISEEVKESPHETIPLELVAGNTVPPAAP